jgi:hypothetical protein
MLNVFIYKKKEKKLKAEREYWLSVGKQYKILRLMPFKILYKFYE